MNDFSRKSVQYSGSRKGWPRERKSVERYGGSRWYKEWFGAHTAADRQTHTHTDTRDHNTFRVVYDSCEM